MSEWIMFEKPPEDRRVKMLRISPALFLGILAPDGTRLVRQKGIPPDAKIIGLMEDVAWGMITFAIHSETFESIPTNGCYPNLEVIYEQLAFKEVDGVRQGFV